MSGSPRLRAVILAAGEGRRMGGSKARLVADGRSMLERHVSRLLEIGCRPAAIAPVIRPDGGGTVLGAEPVFGLTSSQAESLALGLRALDVRIGLERRDRVIITPVDLMPPAPATFAALLAALDVVGEGGMTAWAATPSYRGLGGHPVVVRLPLVSVFLGAGEPSSLPSLREVLRALGGRERVRVPVEDPAVIGDFDTPADWGRPPEFALA